MIYAKSQPKLFNVMASYVQLLPLVLQKNSNKNLFLYSVNGFHSTTFPKKGTLCIYPTNPFNYYQGLTFIGILLMLICAGFTSPLYPLYIGTDSSLFLTISKGIINGKIPYIDLFDHKSPVFSGWKRLVIFLAEGQVFAYSNVCL